jgi:hypothetical protein
MFNEMSLLWSWAEEEADIHKHSVPAALWKIFLDFRE